MTVLPEIPATGGRHYSTDPAFRWLDGEWLVVALADRVPMGQVVRVWSRSAGATEPVRIVKHVAEYVNRRRQRFVACTFRNVHDAGNEWRRNGGIPS